MREVVQGDKHNLRKSANCKAQISSREWMTLICALRFADFLRLCLPPWTTSHTISFSISNTFFIPKKTQQRDLMFSHNPIFAPFLVSGNTKGTTKEPRTRKYLQGLECEVLCWECVCAVCVCEMFVWLLVHVSTNFYGGCVRCVRWNNVRLVTNDFCLHNTGFKTLIYTASKTFRWFFVLALVSTEKSPTS